MSIDLKVFYKSPWGVTFLAYFVAMGLVGALTPPDILTAYSWTRPFTDFMASIVPQIDKVTALGIDPDINRFYFSVMWAGSPVLAVLTGATFWKTRNLVLSYRVGIFRMPFAKGLLFLVGSYVVCYLVPFQIFWDLAPKHPTLLTRGSFGTSIGRVLIPQSFVAGPLLFIGPAFIWILGWLTGYIPRNIRKQNELENKHGN